jgi:hypothetical protein
VRRRLRSRLRLRPTREQAARICRNRRGRVFSLRWRKQTHAILASPRALVKPESAKKALPA